MKLEQTQIKLGPDRSVWTLLTPRSGIEDYECSIMTLGEPLVNLRGAYAKLIVPNLEEDIIMWLDSCARSSINIDLSHKSTDNVRLCHHPR